MVTCDDGNKISDFYLKKNIIYSLIFFFIIIFLNERQFVFKKNLMQKNC